jgi:hypothetical protein
MAVLISEAHAKCYFSFEELVTAIQNPASNFKDQVPLGEVQEEFDKYKLWAGNVGAAHSGKRYEISLDYRLREASLYKTQVRLGLMSRLYPRFSSPITLVARQVLMVILLTGAETVGDPRKYCESSTSPFVNRFFGEEAHLTFLTNFRTLPFSILDFLAH